jgi:protein required for attachment to host cells
MAKHPRVWVVVADGSRARILSPAGMPASYTTVRELVAAEARQSSHELGGSAPGRAQESAASVRHAIEPRVDLHEQAKERFAQEVAAMLNEAGAQGEFDSLVLVAQPRIAAPLRKALSAPVRHKISTEVAKDLTKTPNHELAQHLADVR